MSDRQRELAERRRALCAQSAIQREHLGRTVEDIESRLVGIDRGIEIARAVIKKPVVLAGAIGLIALIGPRRLLRMTMLRPHLSHRTPASSGFGFSTYTPSGRGEVFLHLG